LTLGWGGSDCDRAVDHYACAFDAGPAGAGGVVYSIGLIFHIRESLSFQKAVWHGVVLVAATLPDAAVCAGVVIAHAS
jgi:hemolysin III